MAATPFSDYKISIIKKAEKIIEEFPKIIFDLNDLLATEQFRGDKLVSTKIPERLNFIPPANGGTISVGGAVPVLASTTTIPCNPELMEMRAKVRPIVRKFYEDLNLLQMWIGFMTPKIEDGNNFGVGIQKVILSKIKTSQHEVIQNFSIIPNNVVQRAKAASKAVKYPQCEEYLNAIYEMEQIEFMNLWVGVSEIRNKYSALYDSIHKNMEKLKTPRTSNMSSLY